jgi:hypothetical protein
MHKTVQTSITEENGTLKTIEHDKNENIVGSV